MPRRKLAAIEISLGVVGVASNGFVVVGQRLGLVAHFPICDGPIVKNGRLVGGIVQHRVVTGDGLLV